ncbi:hypothetical protein CHS0354_037639 [Potamilus streckersoni]|uniref:Uncharacterized protein n=1 Tax=Potamilus streckersoni TaxID=2493646 RepID=A0AAE0T8G8_9BIVA|nr:hypothetical protein CHS0354_037639 [Potamilus streckersoni]
MLKTDILGKLLLEIVKNIYILALSVTSTQQYLGCFSLCYLSDALQNMEQCEKNTNCTLVQNEQYVKNTNYTLEQNVEKCDKNIHCTLVQCAALCKKCRFYNCVELGAVSKVQIDHLHKTSCSAA